MMEPKIVTKPAFTVAGMKYQGKLGGDDIFRLWTAFGPRMGELKHPVNPQICYGVMAGYDEAAGTLDYLAACEVSGPSDLPADMVCLEIPAQTYEVLVCTLPRLQEAFEHIYSTWLPQSGYRHAAGPEFELYGEAFDPGNPASEMSVYVPIERGGAAHGQGS